VILAVLGSTAPGVLNPVTVSETRSTYPGWSVSGQEPGLSGSGSAAGSRISASQRMGAHQHLLGPPGLAVTVSEQVPVEGA
jgi:hypothetical protein